MSPVKERVWSPEAHSVVHDGCCVEYHRLFVCLDYCDASLV